VSFVRQRPSSKVAGTHVEQIPNTKVAGGYDTWKRE